jgi:NRPS condensation-like uncharacterized protein
MLYAPLRSSPMANTPVRAIRIPAEEWTPALARATENGETVTDVVRRALVEYVTPQPPDAPVASA